MRTQSKAGFTSEDSAIDRRSFTKASAGILGAIAAGTCIAALSKEGSDNVAMASEDETSSSPTLQVSGTETISIAPDIALVVLYAQSSGDDADTVQSEVSITMDAARQAIIDIGIAEDNIAVADLSVYPRRDYSEDGTAAIIGYDASARMSVSNIEISQIGDVITTAVGAGINSVEGVSYTCSTYNETYDQALALACQRASEKATAIAQALGRTLGDIVSVQEGYENQQYKAINADMTASFASAAVESTDDASSGTSLAFDPGTVDIDASVTIVYTIA